MQPSLESAVFCRAKQDAVAGGHHVALLGGKRLQQPPRGALVNAAGLVLDHADQPEHAEHPSAAADAFVDLELHVEARLVACVEFLAADGAAANEVPLSADPLALQRGLVLESVLPILPRPVGGRARTPRFLRKSARIFFFLPILVTRETRVCSQDKDVASC